MYKLVDKNLLLRFIAMVFIIALIQPVKAQSLEFPKDEGRHEDVDFEAWSFLTHLKTADSSRFGVAIFFFTGKVVGINASGLYVVVSEQKNDEYEKFTKIQIPLINQTTHTEDYLFENYSDNILKRDSDGGPYIIKIDKDDFVISLEFNPIKKPIDMGRLSVGDEGFNRIYAVPRGEVSAKMKFKDNDYNLTGIGIFQHQWGDKPDENLLSDMFALHLNEGTDILIYHSDTSPGINKMLASDADDNSIVLNNFFAKADSLAVVKSTGDVFELNWNIKSPENQIELNILPTKVHQEVEMLDVTYWLAQCRVIGYIKGKPVDGYGYVYIKKEGT